MVNTEEGAKSTYIFVGDELYVRAKIISYIRKENPYSEEEVKMASIQQLVVPE